MLKSFFADEHGFVTLASPISCGKLKAGSISPSSVTILLPVPLQAAVQKSVTFEACTEQQSTGKKKPQREEEHRNMKQDPTVTRQQKGGSAQRSCEWLWLLWEAQSLLHWQ
jgi:hypothetical protein